MAQGRKAFHFDLDEEKLKSLYPSESEKGYKNAWVKIRAFLEKHGFEHAQYSGYESVQPMSYYQAYAVLEKLQDTFPWFQECAQVATLTEIGRRYDVLEHLAHSKGEVEPEHTQTKEQAVSLRSEAASMRRASRVLSEDKTHDPPFKEERGEEI